MGNVRLYGATSGYVEIAPPDIGTNSTVTLPASGSLSSVFVQSSEPTGISTGAIWFKTTDSTLYIYNGTAWVSAGGGGGGGTKAFSMFLSGM
jgi:hypothetical protein